MSDSWKLTLPCTRAEAEAINAGAIEIDAVLMTTELVEDDLERWQLDAYSECEPDARMIAAVRALVPSAAGVAPVIVALTDADWVAMSQQGLEPIREGRFVVYTEAHPIVPGAGERGFLINAGQAFGTGHHATTSGCLAMLDTLSDRQFAKVIDLGTGTGLLAFAARHLWPDAQVTATDIDPVAIEVTRENAALNAVDGVDLIVADGARHPLITAAGPYDLIIANILAGPLIAMAPEIAAIAGPHATIVLAGLLAAQAEAVQAAYRAAGCTVEQADTRGDWTILRLTAAAEPVTGLASNDEGRENWARDI
ncbi:ribosomal protein L11 methyltransferase [Sphingomonas changbaiensis NBRC 104936]|uniref:Ribosomal protein L11 methyltransferase n=1 Tax=Sphingomonas changbaiensis NBRC 104936 TaxID=1219043 RepID=A0A0E9MNV8_9SPHN|nr:50S ribosomal protein L11 methyltransferase [Sphingomonas changbaiensis]GAO39437.1 ribosomal protein L11 methyltransferase [Sphingomonas changbaiensis NBRC 104936]